jgi:hypothetical protein
MLLLMVQDITRKPSDGKFSFIINDLQSQIQNLKERNIKKDSLIRYKNKKDCLIRYKNKKDCLIRYKNKQGQPH